MVAYYLKLQGRRIVRWLSELGLHPVMAGLLSVIVFAGLSKILFLKLETASWVYSFVTISVLSNLGNSERNDKLKVVFTKADFIFIRLLENGLLVLPFIIYFCYEQFFLFAVALIPITVGLAIFTNLPKVQWTIPTPFRKFPFELIVGFRNAYWLIILVYLIFIKAVQVQNYNLGIFSLAVLFLIGMNFYTKPEDEYYCWIFSMGPKEFLTKKITDGIIGGTILTLPLCFALILFFPDNSWITTAAQVGGYIYLISMILAKYSAFPGKLNLAHSIFYGCSILFPPLMVIIIPIFYTRAKRQLTQILGW